MFPAVQTSKSIRRTRGWARDSTDQALCHRSRSSDQFHRRRYRQHPQRQLRDKSRLFARTRGIRRTPYQIVLKRWSAHGSARALTRSWRPIVRGAIMVIVRIAPNDVVNVASGSEVGRTDTPARFHSCATPLLAVRPSTTTPTISSRNGELPTRTRGHGCGEDLKATRFRRFVGSPRPSHPPFQGGRLDFSELSVTLELGPVSGCGWQGLDDTFKDTPPSACFHEYRVPCTPNRSQPRPGLPG